MSKEDIMILIEMEELSHKLISNHIPYKYNEDGEVINEEWEIWNRYWNLVQKILEKKEND